LKEQIPICLSVTWVKYIMFSNGFLYRHSKKDRPIGAVLF